MPDTTSRSRPWLNAAESRLVASSRGEALANASPAELRRKITRARALRDKWRDVYEKQRRGTQQTTRGRGGAANARSREKGDLFDQVLRRLEARLAKLGAPSGGATRRRAGAAKPARARGHRQTRAQAKRALAADVADRASAAARAAQAERPPMQTRRTQPSGGGARRRAGGKKKGTRKKATTRKGASKGAASQAKRASRTADRSATASTRYRLAMSGRTTRVRAHVAARGRRHQARRDRRG
jgi:hypothetical protein